ncbi:sugar kinase [Kitasatospora sp. MMS16-BH015]|uniref:1-phosphofructokinase family hexose kinase n=1 Tax=Kitasatospora sp. MMS16-BH015 TaxID=2018025 RepID=UPI000CA10291|nr:1-phosphofructokinase family hexose kinase [Kitasatospora sp. MMS16-BH015]AUG81976.1 sugar kinase [Kitasatospora sp. MMS16-BH015]
MILTVTLNAALDVTYQVAELQPGGSTRVRTVAERAGGKGVNVSRVLRTLGVATEVTGLAGGLTGRALRADLARSGLADFLVPVARESRRTVAVVDERAGETSILLEPGPEVSTAEWRAFTGSYRARLARAKTVVLSGSLPRGLPADAYALLLYHARLAGVPAVLDTEGEPLLAALRERPALIKPNAHELTATTGCSDPLEAIAQLRTAGARAVVASLGPDGLLAVSPEGRWRAAPPHPVAGNPTGAGDAAVAALAVGLTSGSPWPEVLARAVALSAAAVAAPLAGSYDAALYRSLREQVSVTPLTEPDPLAPHDPTPHRPAPHRPAPHGATPTEGLPPCP